MQYTRPVGKPFFRILYSNCMWLHRWRGWDFCYSRVTYKLEIVHRSSHRPAPLLFATNLRVLHVSPSWAHLTPAETTRHGSATYTVSPPREATLQSVGLKPKTWFSEAALRLQKLHQNEVSHIFTADRHCQGETSLQVLQRCSQGLQRPFDTLHPRREADEVCILLVNPWSHWRDVERHESAHGQPQSLEPSDKFSFERGLYELNL